MSRYDQDILDTIARLQADKAVTRAMQLVKDEMPETIKVQKELALIQAPSFHKKARRKPIN